MVVVHFIWRSQDDICVSIFGSIVSVIHRHELFSDIFHKNKYRIQNRLHAAKSANANRVIVKLKPYRKMQYLTCTLLDHEQILILQKIHIALMATTACVDVTETGKILLSYFILNN